MVSGCLFIKIASFDLMTNERIFSPTELSFPEGATVTNVEFPDEDWWFGHYKGDSGLFPANYVKLNQ